MNMMLTEENGVYQFDCRGEMRMILDAQSRE